MLSFYSFDGDDNSSKVSFGLNSPKSLRSLERKTPLLSSPTSTQYDTASQGAASSLGGIYSSSSAVSPSSSQYVSAAGKQRHSVAVAVDRSVRERRRQ